VDDDLQRAIDRALEAATGHACEAHVKQAAALARFQTRERGGPFWHGDLSTGVPRPPKRPVLPAGDDELTQALEELAYQLVWAADCAEFTDATNNARQFLQAAGHVAEASRPTVGDLAAAYGLDLNEHVPAMGMFPPSTSGVFAEFAWDIHHENPITDPEQLARRALTSYSVGDVAWQQPKPKPAPLGDRLQSVTTPEELAALAPVYATELAAALGVPDAFAVTVDVHMSSWRLETPDGPPKLGEWTVLASLRGEPTGEPLDLEFPAARAAGLGPGDVVGDLRVG
jgi:hypothetical protein